MMAWGWDFLDKMACHSPRPTRGDKGHLNAAHSGEQSLNRATWWRLETGEDHWGHWEARGP